MPFIVSIHTYRYFMDAAGLGHAADQGSYNAQFSGD